MSKAMDKVIIQSRVPQSLKDEAENVFSAMGLTISEAIRLFINQTVNDYKFPFVPKLRQPSAGFKEAINELEEGRGERFDNVDDLFASWEEDK